MLWDDQKCKLEVVDFLHVLFTMVYVNPCNSNRELFWQHLDSLVATDITEICRSPVTENLGKYLRVPLILRVIVKVQQKLSTWKCKLLILPRRITMIQSLQTNDIVEWVSWNLEDSSCHDFSYFCFYFLVPMKMAE